MFLTDGAASRNALYRIEHPEVENDTHEEVIAYLPTTDDHKCCHPEPEKHVYFLQAGMFVETFSHDTWHMLRSTCHVFMTNLIDNIDREDTHGISSHQGP